MKKIFVYEAEPGDWRFDDDPEVEKFYGYYSEISQREYIELLRLNNARVTLKRLLAEIKEKEVEYDWSD